MPTKKAPKLTGLRAAWTKSDDTLKKEQIDKSFKALQRKAEGDVANAASRVDDATNAYDNAVANALGGGDFTSIQRAYQEVKLATKEHELAVELYIELFEEEPKLQ
jgi:hypothetical protein